MEIKRLKQQNQQLALERENTARTQGRNSSNHERALAQRKQKQQHDLQVQVPLERERVLERQEYDPREAARDTTYVLPYTTTMAKCDALDEGFDPTRHFLGLMTHSSLDSLSQQWIILPCRSSSWTSPPPTPHAGVCSPPRPTWRSKGGPTRSLLENSDRRCK